MLEDFKRVLARVQTDYGFYIDCQVSPRMALEGYDLSAEERSALTGRGLAETLNGIKAAGLRITISGTHDWVNRAGSSEDVSNRLVADRRAAVADEVAAIRRADTDEERTEAAVRLMGIIG